MKVFLNKLLTLVLFLFAIGCAYASITVAFATTFINIALFFTAIFVFIQACGMIDKLQGYGKYSENNNTAENQNGNDKPKDDSNEDDNKPELLLEEEKE